MGNCFSCNKKSGIINNWRDSKAIQKMGFETPKQMSEHIEYFQYQDILNET